MLLNMKRFTVIISLFSFLLLQACDEDFLDVHPVDAISDEEAFETLDDFHTGLNGVYASMRTVSYWGKNMVMNFDVAVDDAYAVQGFSNQYGAQYAWTLQAGATDVGNLWLSAYRVITRSSNLINQFDQLSEGSEWEREQILGEARLLRAMGHFDLVRVFASPYQLSDPSSEPGIPVVEQENLEEKSRNTIGEVYDFILDEAHEARDLITRNRHRRYLGVDAVHAFLARVYHEKGNWQKAARFADKVIDARELSAGEEYKSIWREDGGTSYGSDEVIFILSFHSSEASSELAIGSNFVGSNPPLPPQLDWRVDYLPAIALLDLYDKEKDVRFDAFFKEGVSIPPIDREVTVLVKYHHDNPHFSQRGMNQMKVFRVSEAYLVRMEAMAHLGDEEQANKDLAALRAARIENYSHTALSGDALMQAIFDERRKELAFEGMRWFDLKRRGEGFRRRPQPGTGPFNNLRVESDSYRWVWPIPQGEIDANRLIGQNPGYVSR